MINQERSVLEFLELYTRWLLWLVLILTCMLVISDRAEARFDETTPGEWKAMQAETRIPVVVVVVVPTVTPEVTPIPIPLAPVEDCDVETIPGLILYWVPDWCLGRALPKLPVKDGQSLYCMRGFLGPEDQITVALAFPGEERIAGWPLCATVDA